MVKIVRKEYKYFSLIVMKLMTKVSKVLKSNLFYKYWRDIILENKFIYFID